MGKQVRNQISHTTYVPRDSARAQCKFYQINMETSGLTQYLWNG